MFTPGRTVGRPGIVITGEARRVPGVLTACRHSFSNAAPDYYRWGSSDRIINTEHSVISFTPWEPYVLHPMSLQPEIQRQKALQVEWNVQHGFSSQLSADECHDIAQDVADGVEPTIPEMVAPLPVLLGTNALQFLRGIRVLSVRLTTGPYTFDASVLTDGDLTDEDVYERVRRWLFAVTKTLVDLVAKEMLPHCSQSHLRTVLFVVTERNAGIARVDPNYPTAWDYLDHRHMVEKGYESWTVRVLAIEEKVSEIRARGLATRHLMPCEEARIAHKKQEDEDIPNLWKREWTGMHSPQILFMLQQAIDYWFKKALQKHQAGDLSYPSWMPHFCIVFKEF